MGSHFEEELFQRLDRYVRIDTQSDASSATSPSTGKQFDLLHLLVAELAQLGVEDVRLTDYGAVLATIPATVATDAPTIALLAHVDTAPQFTGTGVRPIVHRNYQDGDIVLPDDPQMVLRAADLPYLATRLGEDIVTASGTILRRWKVPSLRRRCRRPGLHSRGDLCGSPLCPCPHAEA